MGAQKLAALLSIALIISGIVSLVTRGGPHLSIDFTGGTIAQIKFDQAVDIAKLRITLGEYGFTNAEIIKFGKLTPPAYLDYLETQK